MTTESVDYGSLARRNSPVRPGVVMPVDAPNLPNFEPNQRQLRAPRFPPRASPGQIDSPFTTVRVRRADS